MNVIVTGHRTNNFKIFILIGLREHYQFAAPVCSERREGTPGHPG